MLWAGRAVSYCLDQYRVRKKPIVKAYFTTIPYWDMIYGIIQNILPHFHRRSWSVRKGLSIPDKRFRHSAVLLPDNTHILVTGGHNSEDYVRSGILWSIKEETWLKGCA